MWVSDWGRAGEPSILAFNSSVKDGHLVCELVLVDARLKLEDFHMSQGDTEVKVKMPSAMKHLTLPRTYRNVRFKILEEEE